MRRLLALEADRIGLVSIPARLYPFLSAVAPSEERPIVIDPRIAFGRRVVQRKAHHRPSPSVSMPESVDDIAADYGLAPLEIEQAIVYERAA